MMKFTVLGSRRTALTLVVVLLALARSAHAQATDPWHAAVGVGGSSGTALPGGGSLLVELGRTIYAIPHVTFDARLGRAWIATGTRVNLVSPVPPGSNPQTNSSLTIANDLGGVITIASFASQNPAYVGVGGGAWTGHLTG